MIAYCPTSGFKAPAATSPLRCPNTLEPLEYGDMPPFDPESIDCTQSGLWRYAAMFPILANGQQRVSLGEGWTPLIPGTWRDQPVLWKFDHLMPTGSYKDRGVSVMINWLIGRSATIVVEDSSGNAGASVACYAACAGLDSWIYVPENASDIKKAQIATYDAELVEVPGPREAASEAAVAATRLNKGTKYASHALQPSYLLGQMTCAWELWEQMNHQVPDWFVTPIGHGGLLLGAWRGFQHLQRAGLINKLPRLVAVQARPYTAIFDAFHTGYSQITEQPPRYEQICSDGISVNRPARSVTVLAAIRYSRGTIIAVDDEDVLHTHNDLAKQGIFVEPTSATVAAALPQMKSTIQTGETVVAVLTGHGLKRIPEVY